MEIEAGLRGATDLSGILRKINKKVLAQKKKVKTKAWQLEALEAIKELRGFSYKGSIFRAYKINSPKARMALNDCKELNKPYPLYFLKVYSELIKKR